ncbi:MAG: taurine transport system permease [Devosia sp.]|nr:taurine transport system permease [Devosia sp.]
MTAVEPTVILSKPKRPPRLRLELRPFVPFGVATAVVTGIVILWHVASSSGWVSPVFLPTPERVVQSFFALMVRGYVGSTLFEHAETSLWRVLSALFFATLFAVPAGLIVATSPVGRGMLDPVIEFLRPLPPLAYLPLVIIWFGIGEPAKVLVIALSMIAPIAISTATGVRSATDSQINAARAFGASRLQVLRHVLLPTALPSILTGIRIALGAGWTTLVAAELVAAARGLGYMMQSAAQFLVTDIVIVGILVIAALSFAFEAILRIIERVFVPWSGHR